MSENDMFLIDTPNDELRSRTMWEMVTASAERFPDRNALVAANDAGEVHRETYRTLAERIRSLSVGLVSIGVRRGDRVALWITNTTEWVIASFAAMRLGATVVGINTFFTPVETKYFIDQSGARHLIMIDAFRKLRMPEMLAEICPEVTESKPGLLYSDELPNLRNVVILNRGGMAHESAYDFALLEETGRASSAREARELADRMEGEVRPTDLAMVKYTSGSTGYPKGAMLEQGGIVANVILHSRRWGIRESDVWFSMMPFFHAGGSIQGLFTMLVNGGTLVFTEAFNPKLAVELIARERATVCFGVLMNEVVDAALKAGQVLPSVRIVNRTLNIDNEDARAVLPNVRFTIRPYGLTEGYAVVASTSPTDAADKQLTTSGQVIEGNEFRVVDPDSGRDVEPGEVGEAWIRGLVMRGYWNKPKETARAIDDDGWLHTEDLVSMDADGYISYVGRLKLMLKVGGENVSLEEIERVVEGHDAVAECGAVGVSDERKDEVVRVYVVVRSDHDLQETELRGWLESRLARFKMPRDIVLVDELPRLGNQKLDRTKLATLATQHLERDMR